MLRLQTETSSEALCQPCFEASTSLDLLASAQGDILQSTYFEPLPNFHPEWQLDVENTFPCFSIDNRTFDFCL